MPNAGTSQDETGPISKRNANVASQAVAPNLCIQGAPNCGHPTPVPSTPTPSPLGTFVPDSPQADVARRYPSSNPGNALLVISQGASAAVSWICVNQATNVPCPNGVTSLWSAITPSGLSSSFSTTTTYGGGATTEYFSSSSSTNPGLYTGGVCLQSFEGYSSSANCVTFVIDVVSSYSAPQPVPTFLPGQQVKIELGPANYGLPGGSNAQIANFGHLYLQVYKNGIPTKSFQAGPYNNNADLLLAAQTYTEFPFSDPNVDISNYLSVSELTYLDNVYLGYQNNNLEIPYYAATQEK